MSAANCMYLCVFLLCRSPVEKRFLIDNDDVCIQLSFVYLHYQYQHIKYLKVNDILLPWF